MSLVHGVIIAGGTGQRLGGVRKADLRIGGRRLIDRVADSLGPLATLMVAGGPPDNSTDALAGSELVHDLDATLAGPLAGLVAAVATLQTRGVTDGLLVSAAVDTPFLPDDLVSVMGDALAGASCVYARWEDQFYPPNALWRLEALQHLPGMVVANQAPHSLRALQKQLGAAVVDWSERSATNPFANLNTLEDLIALGRRA